MTNTPQLPTAWRWPILLTGGACLLVGLNWALNLVAAWAPVASDAPAARHGQIMVMGFIGTLICLERVVALRSRALIIAPLALGAGGLALLASNPLVGQLLQIVGMAGLVVVYLRLARRGLSIALAIQLLGALGGLAAVVLWAVGAQTWAVAPWLAAFLVLTIVGERVELARISLSQGAERAAYVLSAALLVAAMGTLAGVPAEVVALVLLALAGWLAIFDVSRRTIAGAGLPRFAAANMLAATAWLAIGSMAWLLGGSLATSRVYDTVIHSITLGFTISMIIAHAPIILPAVLRRPLPYRPLAWAATIALNVGLAVRIVADIRGAGQAWQLGGIITVVAVLTFVATSVATSLRASTARPTVEGSTP